MWTDPIVEEIHQIRQTYAARFNYDLKAIYNDWKEKEKHCGFKVVSLPIKRRKPSKPLGNE
jgi:hypothetical protein